MLRYLVEQDLEGNADRLKGFAIALDVFGRDAGFDPSTDAVVRVQAGRLRDMISTYYESEGQDDAVRITVPRGSYVPLYTRTIEEEEEPPPIPDDQLEADANLTPAALPGGTAPPAPRDRSEASRQIADSIRRFWFALAAITLMLGVIIVLLLEVYLDPRSDAASPPQAGTTLNGGVPASGLLPTIGLVGFEEIEGGASAVAMLEDALPRFENVDYVRAQSDATEAPQPDFYLRLQKTENDEVRLQLFNRKSGVLVSGNTIRLGEGEHALKQQLSEILSRWLPAGGTLYAYLENEALLNPLTECLVLTSAYFNRQSEERHAEATQCHEELVDDRFASGLIYSDLASLEVEAVSDNYAYPPDASIENALEKARRAIELSPLSAYSYRALERALARSGEEEAALDAIQEAFKLNPYDLNIAASYGNSLGHAGKFEEAADILSEAVTSSPAHPTWWDYSLFISAYLSGREDLAKMSVTNLVGENRPHYQGAKLIVADMNGDTERAAALLAELEGTNSLFTRDPVAFYSRTLPRDAAEELAAALRQAGFVPSAEGER